MISIHTYIEQVINDHVTAYSDNTTRVFTLVLGTTVYQHIEYANKDLNVKQVISGSVKQVISDNT